MLELTPQEIFNELNKYIIGQLEAKKTIAIALRNRWRRNQITHAIKNEIIPKNILLVGSTGVGKTEIARRISKLTSYPFIKVEATKFTEVGYVGKEVESIIRDLTDLSMQIVKQNLLQKHHQTANKLAQEKLIDILFKYLPNRFFEHIPNNSSLNVTDPNFIVLQRELIRKKILNGGLDQYNIHIKFNPSDPLPTFEVVPAAEDINNQVQMLVSNYANVINNITNKDEKTTKIQVLSIQEALKYFMEEETYKYMSPEEIRKEAIKQVEENGIVFIDEIDKICKQKNIVNSGDVSGEGVQRDLLPLVEGSNVYTKHGFVKTHNILFIAAGAFHNCNKNDLIPEIQGRFPIQIHLSNLTQEDFVSILNSTQSSLILQYQALLKSDNYNITFTKESIERIAEIAWYINEYGDNIGARRLHTVFEKLLSDVSFKSNKGDIENITIDNNYVDQKLNHLIPIIITKNYII